MSYSNNPLLPNARKWAVELVTKEQLPVNVAARKAGVHRVTLWRWIRKWTQLNPHLQLSNDNRPTRQPGKQFRFAARTWPIPTLSSRPHKHPWQLPKATVERILALRHELKRCAYIIWRVLLSEGFRVSMASVGRVLARAGLTSSWYGKQGKERRKRVPRPYIKGPGDLVQVDTIHFTDWRTKQRSFVYTLIDLKSRWAFAAYSPRLSPELSWYFVKAAQAAAGFKFTMIQSDNGTEFNRSFERYLTQAGINQRRIRLGRKNDNAHIERFNRTIQDECLGRLPSPSSIPGKLKDYLVYYNTKRLHCSLQGRTPASMLQSF